MSMRAEIGRFALVELIIPVARGLVIQNSGSRSIFRMNEKAAGII